MDRWTRERTDFKKKTAFFFSSKISLKLVMKWFKWNRLKAEVSSVLLVEFPVANTEATLQLRSWLGILWKVFFISFDNEESHLQGKPNEGTDHSIVHNVYNAGKLVLCVFDKLSCSFRAEMPESFIKENY